VITLKKEKTTTKTTTLDNY